MSGPVSTLTGGSGSKMCLNCGTKPTFQNHDYCGKTCAEWAKKNPPAAGPPGWGQQPPPPAPWQGWGGYGSNYGPPPPAPPPQQQGGWGGYNQYPQQAPQTPSPMCQHCQMKPAFPGHQYCSKTCGTGAKQGTPPPMPPQGQGPSSPPASPPQQQGGWGGFNQYPQQAPQVPGPMCQRCQVKPAFPGHPYCSKSCGTSAMQGAAPPMPPQGHGPPPAGYGAYGPQGGQWQQGPPPQGWQPQQQGGQWAGGSPQGGRGWSRPPQNRGQGGPPTRRWNNRPMPGGYGDDDDDWSDEEEEDDYEDAPRRSERASVGKKGKMCINCQNKPSSWNSEFCSKGCKTEADSRLRSSKGSGVARRATIGGGSTRRRATDYEDFD